MEGLYIKPRHCRAIFRKEDEKRIVLHDFDISFNSSCCCHLSYPPHPSTPINNHPEPCAISAIQYIHPFPSHSTLASFLNDCITHTYTRAHHDLCTAQLNSLPHFKNFFCNHALIGVAISFGASYGLQCAACTIGTSVKSGSKPRDISSISGRHTAS